MPKAAALQAAASLTPDRHHFITVRNNIQDNAHSETMLIRTNRDLQCHKGFTLIELMIVLAIIGLPAAIAMSNFIAYRDRARIVTALAIMSISASHTSS
jgi:prepilin-type N-terminal cleavage/methylation domain-containing protein